MKPQRTSSLSYGWAWGGAGAAIRRRASGQGSGALLCLRLDRRPTAFTGCGLVQPLRETARNVLRAWNTELPCDPATACIQGKLNCANLKKLFTLKKTKKEKNYTCVFPAALLTAARKWEQPTRPSAEDRARNTRSFHTGGWDSPRKGAKL